MSAAFKTVRGVATNVSFVDLHGWKIVDKPGQFRMVPKEELEVDHAYQRDKINNRRLLAIAHEWSWRCCGCLLVARREDGTLWVFDGQHRKLAADKRHDVTELPCLIFDVETIREEAKGFVDCAVLKTQLGSFDKFKAQLVAEDPTVTSVQDIVSSSGYEIAPGQGKYRVSCVQTLRKMFSTDEERFRRVWKVCVQVCRGEPVQTPLIVALFYLDGHLQTQNRGDLSETALVKTLVKIGPKDLLEVIIKGADYRGQRTSKNYAFGLVDFLNTKHRCFIPPIS